MKKKNEVIFQTRSTVDRRRLKDRRSLFKLRTCSHTDRRRAKDRVSLFKLQTCLPLDRRQCKDSRLFLQEYFNKKPKRRANIIEDIRGLLSEVKNTFWKKAI